MTRLRRLLPCLDWLSRYDRATATDDGIAAAIDVPSAAQAAADGGLAALRGERGVTRDSLVYAASIALHGTGRCANLAEGAAAASSVLDNGAALARFTAGT